MIPFIDPVGAQSEKVKIGARVGWGGGGGDHDLETGRTWEKRPD